MTVSIVILLELSLEKNIPKSLHSIKAIKSITTIIITATHPPAIIAEIKAFAPAIIAFTVEIVTFIVTLSI